ncbi:MAG: ankyrin repeat domain-containing protein [Elusimicrobiota bacterium]
MDDKSKTLIMAVIKNSIRVVRSLLDEGADINMKYEADNTLLHMAAMRDASFEIAQLLIGRGADIGAVNEGGESIMITASRNNSIRLVKLLLEKGVDAGLCDNNGGTALSHAAAHGFNKIVKLLGNHLS